MGGLGRPHLPAVGFIEAETFDPARWRPDYPNPAFDQRTERDIRWGAQIVAGFTDAHIRAAVATAQYSDPRAADYITRILIERRDKLVRRWLGPSAHTACGRGPMRSGRRWPVSGLPGIVASGGSNVRNRAMRLSATALAMIATLASTSSFGAGEAALPDSSVKPPAAQQYSYAYDALHNDVIRPVTRMLDVARIARMVSGVITRGGERGLIRTRSACPPPGGSLASVSAR